MDQSDDMGLRNPARLATPPALCVAVLALTLSGNAACADAPVIENATAALTGDTWRVDVTLSHPDTGWEHYADGWRLETADGTVVGTRDLLHPHVAEQPFTRSLTRVSLPAETDSMRVRARCNVDGWAADTLLLTLQP